MAPTILVEYLIEYHSSALIKLDGRAQQSEQQLAQTWRSFFLFLSLSLSFFFFSKIAAAEQQTVGASEHLHGAALGAARRGDLGTGSW